MLDMGFIHDIRKIVAKLPPHRQTMLFSATMPNAVAELAGQMLREPVKVAVTPVASTVNLIEQRVIHLEAAAKHSMLTQLLRGEGNERALVFTRTKHRADLVVRRLMADGITAEAIHGNKSQNNRDRTLAGFRDGRVRTLVATDIAARGIDVEGISHVVNFDLPHVPETYVHRIGRTGRAGARGIAISLCQVDEVALLRQIETLIARSIPATGQRSAPPIERPERPTHYQDRRGSRYTDHAAPRKGPQTKRRDQQTTRAGDAEGMAGVAFMHRGGKPGVNQQSRRHAKRQAVQFGRPL
jgi:superfamily II DNA/RNA helicase